MKIECDKCGAKYSIADEKVRGKTFKIRCKKCSNVIIVRDKVAAVAAAAGGAEPDVEADQGQAGWHLAINGETIGPMPEEDVRQRYAAGEIDKDTAIWQEGFEDWVPLGDVEGFHDLPDPPASESDDPFASANQDDYAATAAAAAAAGAAAVAASPSADPSSANEEPQSPRVSRLTGQRNENSVLFSLDSLQALATSAPAAETAATKPAVRSGPKSLATSAPSSEGSGLIDIRALGAMVGSADSGGGAGAASAAAAVDDAALPSFGGAGFGGLAATPLVAQPVDHGAGQAVAPPPARSNGPQYLLVGILLLVVVGLVGFIVMQRQPAAPIGQMQAQQDAPSVKLAAEQKDKDDKAKDDQDEDEDKDKDDDKDKDKQDGDDAGGEDEKAAEAVAASDARSSSKRRKSRSRSSRRSSSKSSTPAPTPTPAKSTKSSSKSDSLDVDCILNPDKPKCGKGGSKKSTKKTGASDPNLPDKPSQTDIKDGVSPVKGSAKACGKRYGAKPGEKVSVRLSISGKSGTVTSAQAKAPHNGTPLGNCVAAALKKAKFKKFRKASIGAVYPIRM